MESEPAINALPPETDEQLDLGSTEDSLPKLQQYFQQLGDVYRMYAPGRRSHTWVISNPDDVRRVLVSNYRNYTKGVGLEDRVKMLLGNGIIVSEGDFWRRQRRMIQPAFHRRVLEQMARMIEQQNLARLGL